MALLFKREAPVLHFGPRLPKDPSTNQRMRWSERRFVLWPALMYRVVAPQVRDRELNVRRCVRRSDDSIERCRFACKCGLRPATRPGRSTAASKSGSEFDAEQIRSR